MKIGILGIAWLATSYSFGSETNIYYCKGGAGEVAVSIHVTLEENSPPGGPVSQQYIASATSAMVGGTRTSGAIEVSREVAKKVEIYSNEEAKFELRILKKKTVNGEVSRVQVEGKFVDPAMKRYVVIPKRWLECYDE